MAVQLGLSAATTHCGIRTGIDRRQGERRLTPRDDGGGRRRRTRRRATFSSLVFSLLTVAFPSQLNLTILRTQFPQMALTVLPSPQVLVSIDRVTPVLPGRAYEALINEAATRYQVEPGLIRSVMQAESGYNPLAVSQSGAMGLMQLMPALAAELGVTDPFNPRENIMAGAKHLRRLLDAHGGNVTLAVASYNAGMTAVARYGAVPPYPETRDYVRRVMRLLSIEQ
jgi:soluble lytic murein transglycosylase-like protein